MENGQKPFLNFDKSTKFMLLAESIIWHKQPKVENKERGNAK